MYDDCIKKYYKVKYKSCECLTLLIIAILIKAINRKLLVREFIAIINKIINNLTLNRNYDIYLHQFIMLQWRIIWHTAQHSTAQHSIFILKNLP
ncbi:hypothetical protein, partial [uncultured Brachyspira sp.]|uniref:hypothetical protein n=1 Tax=uncultured Brachyspira sp. TaxID=221953 RepID=UPI0026315007